MGCEQQFATHIEKKWVWQAHVSVDEVVYNISVDLKRLKCVGECDYD